MGQLGLNLRPTFFERTTNTGTAVCTTDQAMEWSFHMRIVIELFIYGTWTVQIRCKLNHSRHITAQPLFNTFSATLC